MNGSKINTRYPVVNDEIKTLDAVLSGKSIARYGDGEFNLVKGGNCVSQVSDPKIREELARILITPKKSCLVGVPNMNAVGPKTPNWNKYAGRYAQNLDPNLTYWSSFITRPDSATNINTPEYFDALESLWAGKRITMVYGSERSLSVEFPAMKSAAGIVVVNTPRRDAYAEIDRIEREILSSTPRIVLLMCGPAATCLAYRLADKRHAIDLGHIGMFWRIYQKGRHLDKVAYIL
jgi:hypothetical protein